MFFFPFFGKDINLPEAIINCSVKKLRGYCSACTVNISTVFSNFLTAELINPDSLSSIKCLNKAGSWKVTYFEMFLV